MTFSASTALFTGGTWDQNLNYKECYATLVDFIKNHRDKRTSRGKRSVQFERRVVHGAILLTQLRNASRISEAIAAVKAWSESGSRVVYVQALKRRKTQYKRKFVIPKEVYNYDRPLIRSHILTETPYRGFNFASEHNFAKRTFGWNTHSLRYAAITYWSVKHKIPDQTIAKITGHVNTKHISHYTQKTEAEKLLEVLE